MAPHFGIQRSWWIFLMFGILAIVFGVATLFRPDLSVMAMVLAFGVLAVADGIVSLLSAVRRDLALPRWLLVLYALASLGFGALALLRPAEMATAMLWLLAAWLLVAGVARIVFAIQVRKLVRGEWLLALSGVLAIALGVLFFARPDLGLMTMAVWIAIGALLYGVLQVAVALRMRRFSQVM
ncbi:HdeD family acid-resistance protein [Luteimonas granuli]|uniref:HdeD family acid-resistance protein n=1 Tax=Luteimonas granuli TaxID=1176533 RepID=A0A518N4E2_9GAMM|nr:DUF308 domain-containing protein [Luteimonas granuli]QDW66781.1 HdeD family acid-resistance protein [Luteimonas granuli]